MANPVGKTISFLESFLASDIENYKISLFRIKLIIFSPFILLFSYSLLLAYPESRDAALWTLEENGPVELLTVVFAMIGGIQGLLLAQQIREHRESMLVFGFYLAFAAGLIFLGMEECSWGQWFFGLETPAYWSEINTQEELTLHNLVIFNDHLETFPLLFGLGGLLGVLLSFRPWIPHITPPFILLPWFLLITLVSTIDLIQDFYIIQRQLDYLVNFLDEAIEMLVGASGFCFIWLNKRRFMHQWKDEVLSHLDRDRFSQPSIPLH